VCYKEVISLQISKNRLTIYVTEKDKDSIKQRSSQIGRSMSDYLSELVMWDKRFALIEHAREGTLEIIPTDKNSTSEK